MLDRTSPPALAKRPGRARRFQLPAARKLIAATGAMALIVAFVVGVVAGNYASDAQVLTQVKTFISKAAARNARDSATMAAWRSIATHLHDIETVTVALPAAQGAGGGIAAVGQFILYAQPWGEFGYVDAAGTTHPINLTAPMNQAGMRARTANATNFEPKYFRVTDILAEPIGAGRVRLFVGHHRYVEDCVELWLSTADLAVDQRGVRPLGGAWRTIYRAKPCVRFRPTTFYTLFEGHFSGGRIARLDQRRLLFSAGEFGWDGTEGTPKTSRDPTTDLGKIIAIDAETGAASHFASGLRNGQGLMIDSSARIWETEHGPKGGDELNLIRPGGDYGWPDATLGVQYGGRPWPFNAEQGRHGVGIPPVFAWTPSIGVSNLIEAPAAQFPRWRGDLLVASLVDNGLWRLRLNGPSVQHTERIAFDGERLRDIAALPDGRVALLTDSRKLILVRRALEEKTLAGGAAPSAAAHAAPTARTAQSAAGRAVFQSACGSCHGLDGRAGVGPNLNGLIGRKVGGADFPYSPALAGRTETWDRPRLKAFLADPLKTYPGTRMSPIPLSSAETDQLIDYLAETR